MEQLTIDECIDIARQRIQYAQFFLEKAETREDKSVQNREINFMKSIIHHLQKTQK